jgi:hypothetical protein
LPSRPDYIGKRKEGITLRHKTLKIHKNYIGP